MKDRKPLRLEGKFVILEEISPKYFSYVVEWRNNPELNKYLNQNFELTIELEKKWYEEVYLKDSTQGLFILLDKNNGTPFATQGWTNMDTEKRICISGRLLLGNPRYARHPGFIEGVLRVSDYLLEFADVMYTHIVKDNTKGIHHAMTCGFKPNEGKIQYPQEIFVNGMELTEYYCTKEMHEKARDKLLKVLLRK